MNCQRFQDRLYEYVEGVLSTDERAAAETHLAQCGACRQAVHRERQLAQFLSDRLQQGTESLALRPDVRRRILKTAERQLDAPSGRASLADLWKRLAWPLALAISLLVVALLIFNHLPGVRTNEAALDRSNGRDDHSVVSIEVSYRKPGRAFHQEGNLVVDTLTEETVVVTGTLSATRQPPAGED
jgi:anti-sigma-K factor RskA